MDTPIGLYAMMGVILTVVFVVMILVIATPSGGLRLPQAPEDRSILQGDATNGEIWSNELPPITAALNANETQITNVLEPLEDTDAATKGYVDRSTGSAAAGVTGSVQFNDDAMFDGDAQFTYNVNGGVLAVPFLQAEIQPGVQGGIAGLGVQSRALNMGGHNINNVNTINGDLNGTVQQASQSSITSLGTQAASLDMGTNKIVNLDTSAAANSASDVASVQFVLDNVSSGGSPGGPENAIQYKSGTDFAGDSAFTFDVASGIMDVPNVTADEISLNNGSLTRPSLLFDASTNSGLLWDAANSAVQVVSSGSVKASFASVTYLGETNFTPNIGEDSGLRFIFEAPTEDAVSSQMFFDEKATDDLNGFKFTYAASANPLGLTIPSGMFVFSGRNAGTDAPLWGVQKSAMDTIDFFSNEIANVADTDTTNPGVSFAEGTSGGPCGINKRDAGPTGPELGITLGGETQIILDKSNVHTGSLFVQDASSGEPNVESHAGIQMRTIIESDVNSAMEIRMQEYSNTHLNGFTMGFDGTTVDALGYGLPSNSFSLRSYYRFGATNRNDTIFFIMKNTPHVIDWMDNRLTNVSVSSSNESDAANVKFVKDWVANLEPSGPDGYVQLSDGTSTFASSADIRYDSATRETILHQLTLGDAGDLSDPTIKFDTTGDGFFANADGIVVTTNDGNVNTVFNSTGQNIYADGPAITLVGDDHVFMEFCNNNSTSERYAYIGKPSGGTTQFTIRTETDATVDYGIDIIAEGNIVIDARGGDLELDAGAGGDIHLTNNTEVDGVLHTNQGSSTIPTHTFSSRRTTGFYFDPGVGGWAMTNGGTRNMYASVSNTIVMEFAGSTLTFGDNILTPTPNTSYNVGSSSAMFNQMYAVAYNIPSDARIKSNVHPLYASLDIVRTLDPVSYHKKDDVTPKTYWGIIAQDTENALEESGYHQSAIVPPTDEKGLYTVNYTEFIAPLIGATKEIDTTVESLKERVTELETTLTAVLARLDALENK